MVKARVGVLLEIVSRPANSLARAWDEIIGTADPRVPRRDS